MALNQAAEQLKTIRRQLGLSQEDLARQLGVSFATVNRRENGKTKPSRLASSRIEQFLAGKREER
ncbi:helix-turn-helix transcriptional regulator [uncultured Victivallis sp.]|uniref:helix-turn-helix domain-containing protein n=1 Tax=uncultured Victivallis sp. TaxID=354118 RepID=UPI0025997E1A|nr:helix-turn-helix transcriptional regulator [uncultured Victivallis sp.]